MADQDEDLREYTVVINSEEQYSVWFKDRELPKGWVEVGVRGKKPTCLAYIEEVWNDMRPLTVRKQLHEAAATAKA